MSVDNIIGLVAAFYNENPDSRDELISGINNIFQIDWNYIQTPKNMIYQAALNPPHKKQGAGKYLAKNLPYLDYRKFSLIKAGSGNKHNYAIYSDKNANKWYLLYVSKNAKMPDNTESKAFYKYMDRLEKNNCICRNSQEEIEQELGKFN
jgi:hypothetical protein